MYTDMTLQKRVKMMGLLLGRVVFYRLYFSLVELSQVVVTNEYLKFCLSGCCCLLMDTEKGPTLSERCTS